MTFIPTGFEVRRRMSSQPGAEFVAVDVDQGERLDDADAARLGDRGHQLRVAARIHGAADQRHLDAELAGDGVSRSDHRSYFSTVTPRQKATWSLMFAAAGLGSG